MFIMCLDYGIKNIGIAIGQFVTKTATPINSLKAKQGIPKDWNFFKKIINMWLIKKVVIGYPKSSYYNNLKKNRSFINNIKNFVRLLKNKFKLEIFLSDENYTSRAARDFIYYNYNLYNLFYSNYDVHSLSAVYILEMWLNKNY